MYPQIIVVGSSKDNSIPCGVAFFADEMTTYLETQKNYTVKSFRTHNNGWTVDNSIKLIHACLSTTGSILFANFNTRSFARSLLIRVTLLIARFTRKTKVVIIMHEDLLSSPLKLLFNLHILASNAIVVNRPKSQFRKLTQYVLEKKTIYQIKNPPMFSKELTQSFITSYNQARLNCIRDPARCKVGLFGLISREKGFDQALRLLEQSDRIDFSFFTDFLPSSNQERNYTASLQSKINTILSRITLHGRLDPLNIRHIMQISVLDMALFPYRKDAGLWNTTLSLCHYLSIPIIATNSKEKPGWNQEQSIYFIPEASEERLSYAIKHVKNSPQSRNLLQTQPQELKYNPFFQFQAIINSLNP